MWWEISKRNRPRLPRTVLVLRRTLNGMLFFSYFAGSNLPSRSEFNYERNTEGNCVPIPDTTPLPPDDSCPADAEYWYERTAYRKIPYSICQGGDCIDQGSAHQCPGLKGHSGLFWLFVLVIPFGFAALIGYYYYRKSGMARGLVSCSSFHSLPANFPVSEQFASPGETKDHYMQETDSARMGCCHRCC